MKNNLPQEISIPGILIILLILFLNPLGFWMPTTLLMMMALELVVVLFYLQVLYGKKIIEMSVKDFNKKWLAESHILRAQLCLHWTHSPELQSRA